MSEKLSFFFVAVTAAAFAVTILYASQEMRQDLKDEDAIQQTRITLIQAISDAERYASGKASRAELKEEQGKLIYNVKIINDGKATDVHVDGKTGKILDKYDNQADPAQKGFE